MEVPKKIKNRTSINPSNSTSEYLSEENKNSNWKNICKCIFTAVQFTINNQDLETT